MTGVQTCALPICSGSGVGGSDIAVADGPSSTYLSACTKALAASVGPMAKVFVKEAVRRVCGERPFSRADGPALVAQAMRARTRAIWVG